MATFFFPHKLEFVGGDNEYWENIPIFTARFKHQPGLFLCSWQWTCSSGSLTCSVAEVQTLREGKKKCGKQRFQSSFPEAGGCLEELGASPDLAGCQGQDVVELLRAQHAAPARVLVLCPSQQAKENLEGTRSSLDLGKISWKAPGAVWI